MKKSRTAALAVVGAMSVALALSGCSSSSGSTSSGPVTLQLWTGFTGGDRPGYAQIVKDFNASHKDVQVKLTVESWDTITQKLPSAWLTGSGPDIAAPSSDPNAIADYVKTNSLLPITNTGSGDSKINTSDLIKSTIDEYTYNGKLYAVPANYTTLSLYYNKKLFAAAGITNPPTTVAEMATDAQKLTKGGVYGISLADNATIQMWPVLQWLEGGDIVNSNNCSVVQTAAGQKSLETWANLVAKDKVSPVGQTGAQADSLFSAGKAAMEINGPWAAPGYKSAGIDLGIATIPTGVDGKSVTLGSTAPLAISAKTKYPKQAQEFLAYYTSKAVQKKFSLTTGFPSVRTDLNDDPQIKADPTISTFSSQEADARLYLPKVPNATKVDTDGETTLIGQITRGTSIATATKAAQSTINGLTGCSQ
ncbi:sugar ABC transporter substrate-binding protein [Frondihabitans australicus]|uniref:Carbohydrate ABC transporter substrate-binding protein (CUT1 family) n=1 Tax=Frondihabitans australicus TaxID=386892 RepID=A0A495IDP4_9MICO|nr:ABC transporter substrate-binding protein [Frondihabitans australicus]RKR73441.1 carbohydrate ABC transporter substrate-binding protein (CUT1 family) [Frondihabitans australicus]